MNTGLIKKLRLEKGMTQEELASKTEISVRTIQRIENGKVAPRLYTLQSIASVLDIDYEELVNYDNVDGNVTENNAWLPILHLSGLFIFLFPPIVIWIWQKNKVNDINKHAVDIVNFQLSMLIYLIASSFLKTTFIGLKAVMILGLLSTIIIVVNSIRVINNQSYKYPLSINILKKL